MFLNFFPKIFLSIAILPILTAGMERLFEDKCNFSLISDETFSSQIFLKINASVKIDMYPTILSSQIANFVTFSFPLC